MATTAMVASYLRQLLVDEHGEDLREVDGGHELPLAGGVRVWVVDGNHRTRRVLVTARVLAEVTPSAELLEALNERNAATPYGRFFLLDGAVYVEDTLLAEVLDPESLAASVGFVAWAAETCAAELQDRLGSADAVPAGAGADLEVELADRAGGLVSGAPSATPSGAAGAGVVGVGGYL
jgi:hypothetical protein